MTDSLRGRRIHIAGSASKSTNSDVVRYAHRVVQNLARGILERAGGIVTAVGREPRAADGDPGLPSLVFDWTVLETAATVVRAGKSAWPVSSGSPIVVSSSCFCAGVSGVNYARAVPCGLNPSFRVPALRRSSESVKPSSGTSW